MEQNPVVPDLISPKVWAGASEPQARARTLLAEITGQNCEALAEFYELSRRPLFTYLSRLTANPELAEDLLVNLTLEIWREASTYREEEPVLVWLFKLAHRLAYGALPAINSERNEPESVLFELKPVSFKHFTSEAIGEGLAKLHPGDREILILAFYHKFSSHEIATISGRREEEVKHALAPARVALKAALLSREKLEYNLRFSAGCPLALWGWYITQTLSLPELAQAELHLRQCLCCRQELTNWRELQEAIFTTGLLTPQPYSNLFELIERELNQTELTRQLPVVANGAEINLVGPTSVPGTAQAVARGKWWGTVKKQLALRRARRETRI